MKPTVKEQKCIDYARRYYKLPFLKKLFENPNYEVNELKTFSQLWSDFGLRDYGSQYLHRGPFSKDDKIKCIKVWVGTLYDSETNIESWYNELNENLRNQMREFYKNNPGCRIQMQKAEDLIIEKIDEKFGLYGK